MSAINRIVPVSEPHYLQRRWIPHLVTIARYSAIPIHGHSGRCLLMEWYVGSMTIITSISKYCWREPGFSTMRPGNSPVFAVLLLLWGSPHVDFAVFVCNLIAKKARYAAEVLYHGVFRMDCWHLIRCQDVIVDIVRWKGGWICEDND